MSKLYVKDLFKMAYVRNAEALSFFEGQKRLSKDTEKEEFLSILSEKKREQQLYLEKIVSKLNYDISSVLRAVPKKRRLLLNQSNTLFREDLKDIYTFAYEYAVNELDFYTLISSYPGNNLAQSALDTILDLAKGFIIDIKLTYSNIVLKNRNPREVKNIVTH